MSCTNKSSYKGWASCMLQTRHLFSNFICLTCVKQWKKMSLPLCWFCRMYVLLRGDWFRKFSVAGTAKEWPTRKTTSSERESNSDDTKQDWTQTSSGQWIKRFLRWLKLQTVERCELFAAENGILIATWRVSRHSLRREFLLQATGHVHLLVGFLAPARPCTLE